MQLIAVTIFVFVLEFECVLPMPKQTPYGIPVIILNKANISDICADLTSQKCLNVCLTDFGTTGKCYEKTCICNPTKEPKDVKSIIGSKKDLAVTVIFSTYPDNPRFTFTHTTRCKPPICQSLCLNVYKAPGKCRRYSCICSKQQLVHHNTSVTGYPDNLSSQRSQNSNKRPLICDNLTEEGCYNRCYFNEKKRGTCKGELCVCITDTYDKFENKSKPCGNMTPAHCESFCKLQGAGKPRCTLESCFCD